MQTQPAHRPVYAGVVDCVIKTIKSDGLSGLYRGVASPLAGQMFFQACKFAAYGQTSALVRRSLPDNQPMRPLDFFVAGSLAQGATTVIEGPMDLLKTQR